jgi:uncharacterized cupin superfamily protein
MKKPIVNLAELEYTSIGNGDRYEARLAAVGPRVGAQKLGYNVTVLAPGKRAFPRHNHRVNEEMVFVLEGEGEVRIGDARHPIRAGDVIAFPPGGPETAHQIANTSQAELRYLAVSTKMTPEVVDYPDSGKFGLLADFGPGPDGKPNVVRFIGRYDASIGYYEGE